MSTIGIVKNINNVVDTEKPSVSFYPNMELMKESLGFYDNIKSVSLDAGRDTPWIENCTHCRCPMQKILIDSDKILGIPDSVYGENRGAKRSNGELVFQTWFDAWKVNPVLNPAIDYWFCKSCSSVYTIVDGGYCWTKVSINGMDKFDSTLIQAIKKEVILEDKPFDPGPAPSEDSTQCPNCMRWREVKPYSKTHVQHHCAHCKTVGLYKVEAVIPDVPTEEPEVEV